MGGSSVPSSTTTTTMLDPTRQAALKKSMGYFDKWADTYNGPSYQGPLVAGRTQDWYKAQDMAHRLSNRFADGGLTSLRRFDGGGDTSAQPWWNGYNDAQDAQDAGVTPPTDNTNVNTNSTVTGGTTNDTVTGGNYDANASSGNAGNPNLFAQMVANANLGGLYGATGAQPNQISNDYTAGTISPGTVSSGYTAGSISPTTVTSGYTAGTISPGTVSSGYTAGTITPGTVAYSYTPDKLTAPSAMSSDYTAGTRTAKDVTTKDWNQAAMDQYMSPYTKGVVDIALREAERQHAIDLQKQSTAATQSGAFGGYRQGVVEAEGNRNYNQLLNDITTKGQQDAYNAAVAQFNADREVKVATDKFNETSSLANFQALQQAQSNAAQLKLTAAQNNASNTINAYQAAEQAKQAAATGSLSASTSNAANALQASIASEQAKQQAGQMGLTASTANAANTLNAAIASEQAKQQAGQMGLTASTTNATNSLQAAIAAEQAKQQAGQMSLTASTTNATNKTNADIATENAKQQAAQMSSTAAQNNVNNGLNALKTSIDAYNAGITGAQGLAAIETQYNSNMSLAANLLNSTDASARAAGQALIEATKAAKDAQDNLNLTKGQLSSEMAGIKNSNASTVITGKS